MSCGHPLSRWLVWSFGKLREISNLHSHLSHIIHDHPVCYFGNHKSFEMLQCNWHMIILLCMNCSNTFGAQLWSLLVGPPPILVRWVLISNNDPDPDPDHSSWSLILIELCHSLSVLRRTGQFSRIGSMRLPRHIYFHGQVAEGWSSKSPRFGCLFDPATGAWMAPKKTPTAWVVWMGAKKTRKAVLASKKKTFSIEREAAESKLAEGVGLSKAVIRAIPLHHLPSIQRYLEESVGLVGCSWRCWQGHDHPFALQVQGHGRPARDSSWHLLWLLWRWTKLI